jgi:hypothetical protein
MTVPLSPPDLANAVTSFCTIGAGLATLLLCRYVGAQPDRWLTAYFCLFVTGIPTLGWHGWGAECWRVADVGTNLLLAWSLQVAVLGDYYAAGFRRRFATVSGIINLAAVAWMATEGSRGGPGMAIDLGAFGGFQVGETVLIADSVAVVWLMAARRHLVPAAAKPLLRLVIACFVVGLLLATAAGDTVYGQVGSFHALWHVLGAFGFLFFWAFNHVRMQHGGGLR